MKKLAIASLAISGALFNTFAHSDNFCQLAGSNLSTCQTQLASFQSCLDNAGTTLALRECAAKEYQFYDALLNKQYNALMALLSADSQTQLKNAQKAWLDFRVKECDFAGLENAGGTLQPFTVTNCSNTLTKTRIEGLGEYIKFYNN